MNKAHTYSLSFANALILSINAIIGAGLFINPAPLSLLAGQWSCLSYFFVALLIAPLVLVISANAALYKATEGGLFTYIVPEAGKTLGLISISCYFSAKAISCSILLHTALLYLQKAFPSSSSFSFSTLVGFSITCMALSNIWGIKVGATLQTVFMTLKSIPIIVIVFSSYFFFNRSYFSTADTISWNNIASSLPVALYALIGFETCCSIGHLIKGGSQSLARVVLTSFFLVAIIATLFQIALYGTFGPALETFSTPLSTYFELLFLSTNHLNSYAYRLGNLCIALSVFGACYGIVYSNSWNGHMLGRHLNHTLLGRTLEKQNRFNIPYNALFLELFITTIFSLSAISILVRARLAVIGITLCYLLTTWSLFKAYKKHTTIIIPKWITLLSFFSCFYIIGTCIKDLLAL